MLKKYPLTIRTLVCFVYYIIIFAFCIFVGTKL